MNDQAALIIAALCAGLAALIAVIFAGAREYVTKWFKVKTTALDRRNHAHGLDEIAEFSHCIDSLRALAYVDRVLLFKGQNCGGVPTPGERYTVRAVEGWSKTNRDIPDLYRFAYKVDEQYCLMLKTMIEKGLVINTTSKMPDDALLKNLYREEQVFQSILYFINISDNELLYLSVASYTAEFTPSQITRLDLAVQRLRALVR